MSAAGGGAAGVDDNVSEVPIKQLAAERATYLAEQHPVPVFDEHVRFDDASHTYTVDGYVYRGSVTGFIHSFFGEFDSETVAERIVKSGRWRTDRQYKYYQRDKATILAEWAQNGADARERGTDMHAAIECRLNGIYVAEHAAFRTFEYSLFCAFWRDHVDGKLEPFRTELSIFDDEFELAGQIDGVFRKAKRAADGSEDHLVYLYDWKRAKEIKFEAFRDTEVGKGPLAHLADCNGWHYAIQLSVYRWMLERHTPYRVVESCLARFHPSSLTYERIVVPYLEAEVEAMAEVRRKKLLRDDLQLLSLALDPPSEPSEASEPNEKEDAGASNGLKRPRHVEAEDVVPRFKRFRRRLEPVLRDK